MFLQVAGADLSRSSDMEATDFVGEETCLSEDLAQDGLQDENDAKISIQAISLYGDDKILASPQNLSLKPGNRPPGNDHSISASFVAFECGYDIETVLSWARTGSHFIRLEWTLAGNNLFPRFTTRHVLIEDGGAEINLSGGLGFALRLLKHIKTLDMDASPFLQQPQFVQPGMEDFPGYPGGHRKPSRAVYFGSQPRPSYFQDLDEPPPFSEHHAASLQRKLPHMPFSLSLPSDQVSVSTDCTGDSLDTPSLTMASTATTWLDDSIGFPGLLSTSPAEFSDVPVHSLERLDSCKPEGCTLGHLTQVDRRLQGEAFGEQKRKAEAMYAHNGDTSGMASLASACTDLFNSNSDSFWDPSGIGRF